MLLGTAVKMGRGMPDLHMARQDEPGLQGPGDCKEQDTVREISSIS